MYTVIIIRMVKNLLIRILFSNYCKHTNHSTSSLLTMLEYPPWCLCIQYVSHLNEIKPFKQLEWVVTRYTYNLSSVYQTQKC